MPKRTDIHTILIIGSGPIVIGQGCEFDYSGVQACRALKEEGYRIVLVNSNPATIMTDPEFADATYIEPITPEAVEKIIEREAKGGHPIDAVLPTLGGQTGLNTAVACYDKGIFKKHNVQMIGANREAIYRGEDRQVFKDLMIQIGLEVPRSGVVHTMDEARVVLKDIGLPLIIRPAFTLGGTGGGIAYNVEEFEEIVQRGIDASPVNEVLIEQSVIGWKEYELEVMRDKHDNVVIICSIENIDAMGVHTGDSITVAPVQTLTDKEYQRMRDGAIKVIRAVGVETGGSNIQFAVDPATGRMVVVEMNPRVSRSSALASKATGYPIAKIAAKLAVGYTLDELPNYITSRLKKVEPADELTKAPSAEDSTTPTPLSLLRSVASSRPEFDLYTSACFEPTIDYCVIKIPRWTFEKFPDADETLTTQMKSVGEAMAIGRTFKEALQKGIRSMEVKRFGFGLDKYDKWWNADQGRKTIKSLATSDKLEEDIEADLDADKTTQGESLDLEWPIPEAKLRRKLSVPSQGRMYYIRYAMKMGWTIEQIYALTHIDRWFLAQFKQLVDFEPALIDARELIAKCDTDAAAREKLTAVYRQAKEWGYSGVQLSNVWGMKISEIRALRKKLGIEPVYKLVDTCAAEFEAATPYYYSSYETPITQVDLASDPSVASPSVASSLSRSVASPSIASVEDEIRLTTKKKVAIIGGGPNRIGQGIEFDYCCVHAAFAMDELGYESVMINSNPETVSTDYDTSDLLFFEPLTHEDVLNACERINGGAFGDKSSANLLQGIIVQFGGQTPLNLARGLMEAGVPILGTTVESLDAAGDREQFRQLCQTLGIKQPENGIARSVTEAKEVAKRIGYPVLVRPSFVLGGRAMEIVFDEDQLNYYMQHAVEASTVADAPILVDKFLDNATEVDVDCIADYAADGTGNAVICGVMEHIEEAGIHSGDSACALPPHSLGKKLVEQLKEQTRALARALKVRGLMNVQYAIKDGQVYIIEVNPRASRTVPFVSKATGMPWAKIAAKVMAGKKLAELGINGDLPDPKHVSVKEVVFPFSKFPGVDVILGPEMRSTGEVMGIDKTFPMAFAKSQIAAGGPLPTSGTVFISVNDRDKKSIVGPARVLVNCGFRIVATQATAEVLQKNDVPCERINKLSEGRPNIRDLIKNGEIKLIINTPTKKGPQTDEGKIRAMAVLNKVCQITTLTGASAAAKAIPALQKEKWDVRPLQDYHPAK
jgi:carbamoyl-phosphate synthase large subunit